MTSPTPRGGFDPRKALGRPLLTYFDNRFREVHDRIRELSEQVDDQLQQLYGRVATEVETISEMTLGMQRFFDISAQQVDDLLERMASLAAAGPSRSDGARFDAAGSDDARLVESAYALSAAGARPGLRVLHIGSGQIGSGHIGPGHIGSGHIGSGHIGSGASDAGVPLALASLGCLVTAVGHQGPSAHPNLAAVEGSIDTWGGADTLFDRVLWLPSQLDQRVLDLLAKCLDVDGELVASVRGTGARPATGTGPGTPLPALGDWTVLERRVVARRDGWTWETVAENDGETVPESVATVTLLRATPRT